MASHEDRFLAQPEQGAEFEFPSGLSQEQLEVQGALLALLEGDEDGSYRYTQPHAQLAPEHPLASTPFPAYQPNPAYPLWPTLPPAPRFDPATRPPTSLERTDSDAFPSHVPANYYPYPYAPAYPIYDPPPEPLIYPPTFGGRVVHAPGTSQGMWRRNGRGGGRGWHEAPAPDSLVESYSPVQPHVFGWQPQPQSQPPPPSFAAPQHEPLRATTSWGPPTRTVHAPVAVRPRTACLSISAIFDAPQRPTASPPAPAPVAGPPPRALPVARTFQVPPHDPPSPVATAYNSTVSPSSSTSSSSRASRTLRPTDLLPAAHLAAANRERFGTTATGAWNRKPPRKLASASSAADPERVDRRKGSKLTAEHRAACSRCEKEMAVLIYRGTREEIQIETEGGYRCGACEPLPERPAGSNDDSGGDDERVGWDDTLSAAVDRLQGLDLNEGEDLQDERGLPPSRARTSILLGRKRRAEDDVLMCDVCTREIGTGGLVVAGSDHDEVPFSIECVCIKCHELYQRCSDCGGAGGPRLGVGKWRCKELFPGHRKTCRLSHLRMGPLSDMTYDVWQVRDLPPAELEDFIVLARDLYMYQIIAGLATPDMLESVTALARTYEQVQKMAVDSWTMVEPLLREDIESARGTRRYVGMRWSNPPPRKRKGLKEDTKPEPDEEHDPTKLIRSDKNLASYVLCEVDLAIGSLCISIQTPWTTGDTFNATTLMMRTLLRRIDADILADNAARAALRPPLPAYPRLRQAWIMMFFKKDSRLYRDLLNRRSFLPVDEYVARFGEDPAHFAPIRPVFLPREYLKGWHVLVRQVVENDEWGGRSAAEAKKEKKRRGLGR